MKRLSFKTLGTLTWLMPLSLLINSCTQNNVSEKEGGFITHIADSITVISINKDSLTIITPGQNGIPLPETYTAGQPKVVLTNTNIHTIPETKPIPAGKPNIVKIRDVKTMHTSTTLSGNTTSQHTDNWAIQPDETVKQIYSLTNPATGDTLQSPKTLAINLDSLPIITAGIPEVVIAKDPHIRDENSQSFSSFSKLQGLKHDVIHCMLQDRSGNLWFGTFGGGVSKYDGETFTHFTEKEGLSNNNVWSMIEDKSGNLWLGTYGGGVSKYDGKTFTHFTEKEGLSNNKVWSILEDKNGNLWFGTDGGVSKLVLSEVEGNTQYNFTHFTKNEGLSNNIVLSIIEDKSGNLWFGTDGGGVSKYDGETFMHFTEKEGLSNNIVWSILEDKNGNLWFGTDGGGVSKYDGNRQVASNTNRNIQSVRKSFTHYTTEQGLSNNKVKAIFEDESGNLWFATDGGVSKYNDDHEVASNPNGNIQSVRKTFTHFTEKEGLSNNNVWSILEDKSGNLWFGNEGGVSKYDGETFTHFTEKEGLSNNIVLSILEDKSGNLWLGTYGGGVSKYDGDQQVASNTHRNMQSVRKTFTHFTKKEGLSNNYVLSILEDKSGNLWFGTYGGGVSKYDGNRQVTSNTNRNIQSVRKTFTHFTTEQGLSNNIVRSILEDKNGNLWFGTYGGGVSKLALSEVDGNTQYTFTHFTEKEGLSNNYIWSILEDKSGNLWFSTYGGGVSKLALSEVDGNTQYTFTHFTEKEGLSNNIVRSILEDKSGNLWFGTDGGVSRLALSEVDGNTQYIFTHFTEKEGLSNNYIFGMALDKNDNLWFGTRFGLSKLPTMQSDKLAALRQGSGNSTNSVPTDEVFFKNYGYYDGFLGIGVNGGGNGKNVYEASNGTIWIAANDRLTAYHPDGYVPDTIAPNVQLTGIELFGESVQWTNLAGFSKQMGSELQGFAKDTSYTLDNGIEVGNFQFDGLSSWYSLPENLSLAYNNNNLTFNFIGITMCQPKKVKYQYMLEGMDENWSVITNKTYTSYGNLPHGNYIFKVKAMNSEGYWSPEFAYNFEIRPPWWHTWWFRSIYITAAVLALFGIYNWRTARLKSEKKILEQKVKERTTELQQANEEIITQRDMVTQQKEHIEEIHKKVTDSINYAERIQNSALPDLSSVKKSLSDIFVYFKPHSVVSGDFYWYAEVERQIVITVADCTGHGVPGAFMSMMGMSMLKEIVEKEFVTQPDVILQKLRKEFIRALGQKGELGEQKDGMDMSLCSINKETFELQWAGANNPCLLVREGELKELKPNKMPICIFHKMDQFTLHKLSLKKNDIVYLISDGYPDQFGGPKGKKFMSKKLKELLLEISSKPMKEQHEILENRLFDWMNNYGEKYEQIDDITIMGIKI